FLKANSRPIFFDPTLNSASIIIKNIYDIFTLSARKLHETVTSLKRTNPQAWKFGAMKTMIEGLFVALYQIIRTYISQLTCGSKLLHWIDKKAVRNLGAEAYLKVLKAKQTSYNPSFLKWLENMKVL
ncbi:uncharacterized protein H6S33_005305, partial [Morchella sextelata]|uniref:uncharacterized protein n=1 Tax=Morchella sextelata TaxID=1174677 RepID=UPI001D037B99